MWACSRGFVIICKIIKYSTFSNICQYFLTAGMTIMTPRSREVPIQWFWLPLAPSIQTLGTRSIFYFSSSSSSFLPSRQESFKQHFFILKFWIFSGNGIRRKWVNWLQLEGDRERAIYHLISWTTKTDSSLMVMVKYFLSLRSPQTVLTHFRAMIVTTLSNGRWA